MTTAEAATSAAEQWDVFISYAREDYIQAKDLLDALSECVTTAGGAPRIYLDVSRTGTPGGADWQSFLEEALPAAATSWRSIRRRTSTSPSASGSCTRRTS